MQIFRAWVHNGSSKVANTVNYNRGYRDLFIHDIIILLLYYIILYYIITVQTLKNA